MIVTVIVNHDSVTMKIRQHEGETLKYLTIEPDDFHSDRRYPMVILLHGFGSHMSDLARLSSTIGAHGYVYVCPNAPIPLTLEYGDAGFAWTRIGEEGGDAAGLDAEKKLHSFIQDVTNRYHVQTEEMILGGFSQGGMMAYRLGLTNPDIFRGIAVLSGRLPNPDSLLARLPKRRTQAIFITHGIADTIIPVGEARQARELLESQGYVTEYQEYASGHEVSQDLVATLSNWIRRILPPADESF